MPDDGQQRPPEPPEGRPEPPEYNVYRSRRGLLSRLRGAQLPRLGKKDRAEPGAGGPGERGPGGPGRPGDRWSWLPWRKRDEGEPGRQRPRRPINGRRIAKWLAIAVFGWILISFLAFAVSAQLQS